MFTQTTAQTTDSNGATQAAAWAMMPRAAQTYQNQQPAQSQQTQRQQTQRQSQDACAKSLSFTQAENNPVFCFFYSYQIPHTQFTQRSGWIEQRLGEIVNHAHKGGARI